MSSQAAPASEPNADASIFDAPRQGLRGRFAGGALFTLSSQVVRMGTQLVSLAVISRMLSPAAFGVMAMATPVLLFLSLIQDLGLTQATVQRKVLTQRQASNMFWTSTALGVAVAVMLAIAAPFIGMFYREMKVSEILWASAPLAIIASAGAQHRALLMRQMMFRKLMIRDMAGLIAGMIAAVVCALVWHSYWALYASNVATTVVGTAGAIIATRWKPSKPAPDMELREMIGFGAGLSGYTLANFFSRYMGNILIGRFWGGAALGLYDRGYRILLFPLQQINQPIVQVMNPALAKLSNQPERYREAYKRIVRVIMLFTLPGILLLAVVADWAVPLVLGGKWVGVVPIFRDLAIVGALQTFNGPIGVLFITQARTGQLARWGVIYTIICNISFAAGLPWGPEGVALAYGATELVIRTPLYWWWAGREGPVKSMDLAGLAAPYAVAAIVVALLLLGGRMLWSPHSAILGLIVYGPVCYALFWGLIAVFPSGRSTFRAGWELAEGFLHRLLPSLRPATAGGVSVEGGEG